MAEADELVRWTVKVSKDTDVSLRSFLAQRGLKKGDLSKFIERAVQKEVFAQTVAAVQARNAGVSSRPSAVANAATTASTAGAASCDPGSIPASTASCASSIARS